jgi:hypothetical protein
MDARLDFDAVLGHCSPVDSLHSTRMSQGAFKSMQHPQDGRSHSHSPFEGFTQSVPATALLLDGDQDEMLFFGDAAHYTEPSRL